MACVMRGRVDAFGCDLATGRTDRDGYAFHGSTRAHVVAWTARNGPVPADKELDHLCRRRNCRSWWHLEPVTRSENEKRKSWRYRSRIKLCPAGHDLSECRVVTPEGGVVCRTCNRENAS